MNRLLAVVLFAGSFWVPAAHAGSILISGDTTGGPTWNRPLEGFPPAPPPSGVGTAVPYELTVFSVTSNGLYSFVNEATSPGYDNYLHLYRDSFDPATQFTNILAGNDDFPTIGRSGFDINLLAGVTYISVTSGFANTDFGTWEMTISGPGDITVATVSLLTGDTTGRPTWNRPLGGFPPTPPLSGVGTAVPYEVSEFAVTLNGFYSFLNLALTPGYDNFLHLYRDSFDPADQFTNILAGNDDFPTIGRSGFGIGLLSGVTYFAVTSGFANNDFGAWEMSITGPGAVIRPGDPVPAPTSLAALAAALGLMGALLRARSVEDSRHPC